MLKYRKRSDFPGKLTTSPLPFLESQECPFSQGWRGCSRSSIGYLLSSGEVWGQQAWLSWSLSEVSFPLQLQPFFSSFYDSGPQPGFSSSKVTGLNFPRGHISAPLGGKCSAAHVFISFSTDIICMHIVSGKSLRMR